MTKLRIQSRASRLRYPGVGINTFEVRSISLNDLHCPVRDVPSFADGVENSIREQGLANPIIVVRGPREDLARELESLNGRPASLPKTPVVNVVYGGTNRVTAARMMGYTHVDCVLLPSFELALRVQEQQRNTYNGTTATQAGS